MSVTEPADFALLGQLWLREPDADVVARAKALGVAVPAGAATPAELAVAYADLFILNVYPYGTVYTDAWGEINTPAARRTAALYEQYGFQPPELSAVGAPDHLGLCLTFLGELLATPGTARMAGERFLRELAFWAPVCCLAAERDPTAHEFYRAVARSTREALLNKLCLTPAEDGQAGPFPGRVYFGTPTLRQVHRSRRSPIGNNGRGPSEQARPEAGDPPLHPGQTPVQGEQPAAAPQRGGPFSAGMGADEEVRLRDIVRFLLAPARCGMFLSRARLGMIAKGLGLRLPFGSRFEVAEWLFSSAGQNELVPALIAALRVEVDAADACFAAWAELWPEWRPAALYWLECVADTRRTLLAMESMTERIEESEFSKP